MSQSQDAPNEREKKYIEIPLHALRLDRVTEFALYLQPSPGKYVLYRNPNLMFDEEHRDKLEQNGTRSVFIAVADRKLYLRYLEQYLNEIISDPDVSADEESKIVYACATQLLKEVIEDPSQQEGVKRAHLMVDNAIEHLLKGPDHFMHVFDKMSFDYHTYTHSVNVCVFGLALGQRIGLSREELSRLGAGLLLHDIGKSKIDEAILNKQGPLSDEEWELMRTHPTRGREILAQHDGIDPIALAVVEQHHEKCTGGGYPHGLQEPEIHFFSKICTLADVFDALTTQRSYKEALASFPALKIMQAEMRTQFHEGLFKEFIRMLGSPISQGLPRPSQRKAA